MTMCGIPEYINDFTDCVTTMNFIDCPTFSPTDSCERTLDFVKFPGDCGRERNGIRLIDQDYFEFEFIDPKGQIM